MTDRDKQSGPTTASVPLEKLGAPGHHGQLIVTYLHKDETRSQEEILRDRTPREHKVSCALSKCVGDTGSLGEGVAPGEGDSHFRVPKGVEGITLNTPVGDMTIHANAESELATAEMTCTAGSHADAFEIFTQALTPWLDYFSFANDVPVVIVKLHAWDPTNRISATSYVAPHVSVLTEPDEDSIAPELIPVYALYREAKNSWSNFYRFLCYFKIMEGIYHKIRPGLMEMAKSQGISIATMKETVPDSLYADVIDARFAGRPINDVFSRELQSELRRVVAHFVTSDGNLLNPSEYSWGARFARIVRVAQACARVIIQSQERHFAEFTAAGGKRDPA
ncbi:hypothetical protein KAT82_02710 [bacterium]|nr:hypothetical protein [bacterium]